MLATALRSFAHEGRQVQAGDRLHLAPAVASWLAAQGLVRADAVLVCRGGAA